MIVERDILGYKPFIDGLRAVSIIAVVGYHVGLPGFGGGYVGVDVFFVISGFLIINQIAVGIGAGRFSLTAFYARRALRILPPLLAVLLACIALAPFILVSPWEYLEFGRSLTAAALMVANHYFLQHQGYFGTPAKLEPLLHLWTLSVEEQFYILAPFVLLAAFRLMRRWRRAAGAIRTGGTAALFLLSLAGCILLTARDRNVAFFVMPLRGWEFILGGAIGLAPAASATLRRHADAIAGLGLLAVLAAVLAYGSVPLYPSAWPLLPVGGAAAVILAGLVKPDNLVARWLALRPMVGIGRVSYGWYLWHWPLLVFARLWNFGVLGTGPALAVAAISFLLAVATYAAIERPARTWRRRLAPLRQRQAIAAGVAACVATAFLGFGIFHVAPLLVAQRFPIFGQNPNAELKSEIDSGDPCVIRVQPQLDRRCVESAGAAGFGLLIGDSHALAIYTTLRAEAARRGVRLIYLEALGCAPLLPGAFAEGGKGADICSRRYEAGLRSVSALLGDRLSFAILEARWTGYRLHLPGAGRRENGLTRMLQRLAAMHVRRILVVGPVPLPPVDVRSCLVRARLRHLDVDGYCATARPQAEARRASAVAVLRATVERFGGARYLDPMGAFCDDAICRPYSRAGAFFLDDNHLSPLGAERLYAGDAAAFDWAFRGFATAAP